MGLYNVHSSSIIHNKLSQPAGFNKNKQKNLFVFSKMSLAQTKMDFRFYLIIIENR